MRILLLFISLLVAAFDLFPCTIAVVNKEASLSGRPILWKNRDVSAVGQEVRYFNESPFGFLALVYRNETGRAWAGINTAGFAIVNSNSYNLADSTNYGIDDGILMWLALKSCSTVDDFEELLLRTRLSDAYNFGVIDAYGGSALFEVSPYGYMRINVGPNERYIVRTNFSISGSPETRPGLFRYLRARQLIERRLSYDKLDYKYIIDTVASDLCSEGLDPYPLPYDGTYRDYPFGCIPLDETINRYYTRACLVIEGKREPNDLSGGVMFTLMGQPVISVPVPVWLMAKDVPSVLQGWHSSMCFAADSVRRIVEHYPSRPFLFDTYSYIIIQPHLISLKNFIYENILFFESLSESDIRFQQEVFGSEIYFRYSRVIPLLAEPMAKEKSAFWFYCYPNPFNSFLTIVTSCKVGQIEFSIYNINGRLVRSFHDVKSGKIEWDARDDTGNIVPCGLYFIVAKSFGFVMCNEVLFLR